MDFSALFQQQGSRLYWRRIPDEHVLGHESGAVIEPGGAYAVLRLTEMYLGRSRTLWRKRYPLVHSLVSAANVEEHNVAGPRQLQVLGTENLDRVMVLNSRLAGPIPVTAHDFAVTVGLWAVPGDDAARALVSTVSAVSELAGAAAAPAAQVLNVIKSAVDSILRLDATTLRLGVSDVFFAGNPLRAGFHVGIGAEADKVDSDRLWLRGGELVTGADPIVAKPYREHDYFVVQIERLDIRPDWAALPDLDRYTAKFSAVLAGRDSTDRKRGELSNLWPEFQTVLQTPLLTRRQAQKIEADVRQDLQNRLAALDDGNPFEVKSWASDPDSSDPAHFDLAEVPDYTALGDAVSPTQPLDNPFD